MSFTLRLPSTLLLFFLSTLLLPSASPIPTPYDPSVSLSLTLTADFSLLTTSKYILIVTDQSQYLGNTFAYVNQSTSIARIISARKFDTVTTLLGNLLLPALQLPSPGILTFHYLKVTEDPSNPFAITASPSTFTGSFPSVGDDFPVTARTVSTLGNLAQYETIIYTTYVGHSSVSDITCSYEFTYSGVLRGIYFNDNFEMNWQGSDINYQATVTKTDSVTLKGGEFTVITLIGRSLQVQSFGFKACSWLFGTVSPDFYQIKLHYPSAIAQPAVDYSFSSNTTYCANYATKCLRSNYALQCHKSRIRLNGVCQRSCSGFSPNVNRHGDCVSFTPLDYEMGAHSLTTTSNTFSANIVLDTVVLTRFLLLLSPDILPSSSAPLLSVVYDTVPSVALTTASIITYTGGIMPITSTNPIIFSGTTYKLGFNLFELETDANKTLLVKTYASNPQHLEPALLAYEYFYYGNYAETQKLLPTKFIVINTFLECVSTCTISIYADGTVRIYENLQVLVATINFGSQPWTFTLSKSYTNTVVPFTFELEQSTQFRLDVHGDSYTVFTNSFFRMRFPITFPGATTTPLTASNCATGQSSQCYTCADGYFLDPSTSSCVTTCPSNFPYKNLLEKSCISSCDSSLNTDLCYAECSEPGKYYVQGSGCTGDCPQGCSVCRNNTVCLTCTSETTKQPNGACKCNSVGMYYVTGSGCTGQCSFNCQYCMDPSQCLQCSSNTILDDGKCVCPPPKLPVGAECQCPAGTLENPSTLACELVTYLDIIFPPNISTSSNLILQATINPAEEAIFTPVFTWTVTSTSTNTAVMTDLQNTLVSQTTKTAFIPSAFLEPSVTYTFTAKYNDLLGRPRSKSAQVLAVITVFPQVTINGGTPQSHPQSEPLALKAEISPADWPYLTAPLTVTWSQTGGDFVNTSQYTSSSQPLLLNIPGCVLKPAVDYKFKVSVTLKGSPDILSSTEVVIKVPVELGLMINGGNRSQSISDNLALASTLSMLSSCGNLALQDYINTGTVQYIWDCSQLDSLDVRTSCPDPLNLFDTARSSPSLTVPSSYFTQGLGLQYAFDLKAVVELKTSDLVSVSTQASYTITGPTDIPVSFSCYSYRNSCKISTSNPGALVIAKINYQYGHYYRFAWGVSPLVPYYSFFNYLKIVNRPLRNPGIQSLRISLIVTDSGKQGSAFLQLPINQKPTGGILSVYPSSGYSQETDFFISTSNWIDEDIPLSYQFFYSADITTGYKRLTTIQKGNYITTKLLSPPKQPTVNLQVIVTDALGASNTANTTVDVQIKQVSVTAAAAKAKDFLSNLSAFDPAYNFGTASLYIQDLVNWGKESDQKATTGCTTCSYHGTCQSNGQCVCDKGYLLADCSMKEEDVKDVINTKVELLKQASSAYTATNDTNMRIDLLDTLKSVSSSVVFNSPASMMEVQKVVKSLNIDDEETVFTDEESRQLATVLSNMLSYASATDCDIKTPFTKNLEAVTYHYLKAIGKNTLSGKFPGEDATVFADRIFDVYTQKTTLCSLSNVTMKTSEQALAVEIDFDSTGIDPDACLTEVDIKYYVFSKNLFECDAKKIIPEDSVYKLDTALNVQNDTDGSEVVPIQMVIHSPVNCPATCQVVDSGTACKCNTIEKFDLRERIGEIFRKSRLSEVSNVDVLKEFQWGNIAFWSVMVFTGWFCVSLFLVRYRLEKYCMLEKFKTQAKTRFQKARLLILITHPLLGSYLYRDPYISKTTRIILYYTRMILVLTYSSLFSDITWDEDFSFSVFILIFNYLTVIPLYLLLHYLLEVNKESTKYNSHKFRYRLHAGVSLTAGILIGCFFINLVVSTQFTPSQQVGWLICFIISVAQDIFISPILGLLFDIIILKAYHRSLETNSKLLIKILSAITDRKIRRLHAIIFPTKVIKLTKNEASPKNSTAKKDPKHHFRIVPLESPIQASSLQSTGRSSSMAVGANTPMTNRGDSYNQDSEFMTMRRKDSRFFPDQEQESLKLNILLARNSLYREISSPRSIEEERTIRESFKSIPEKSPKDEKEIEFRSTDHRSDRPSFTALDFSRIAGSDTESECNPVIIGPYGRKFYERKGSRNSERLSVDFVRKNSGKLEPLNEVTEENSPQVRFGAGLMSFASQLEPKRIIHAAGNGRRTRFITKSKLMRDANFNNESNFGKRMTPPTEKVSEEKTIQEEGEDNEREEDTIQVDEL